MTVRQRDGGQAFAGGTTCWQGGESQEGLCPPALDFCLFHPPSETKKQPTNCEESGKPKNYEDFVVSGLWAAGPPKPKNCPEFDTEKVNPSNAGFL